MSKSIQNRAAVKAARSPVQFLREVQMELRKVKWPTWEEVVQMTGVVILTIIFVGAYVAILDFLFSNLFRYIGMYA